MKKITLIVPLAIGKEIESPESLEKQGEELVVIKKFGNNPSKNRNEGVKSSKTEYVAFINGHTILDENWLKEIYNFINEYPQIDVFGGPQLNPISDSFFAKVSGYALASYFGAAKMSNRYKQNKIDFNADEFKLCSANLICKRIVFDKVQFDENIYPGEDPKFITDAKNAGFKIAYSPNMIVYNKRRTSFLGLFKQIFSYGKTRSEKENIFETLKHLVFFIPSLFFLYLLCLSFLLFLNYLFIIPLIFYFVLAVCFSFFESIKNREFFALFFMPFIFLAIHLSYGIGFLYGTIFNKTRTNKN